MAFRKFGEGKIIETELSDDEREPKDSKQSALGDGKRPQRADHLRED